MPKLIVLFAQLPIRRKRRIALAPQVIDNGPQVFDIVGRLASSLKRPGADAAGAKSAASASARIRRNPAARTP
jgi:hypothetical protein